MELKSIADVGLVGFPNVGKSTHAVGGHGGAPEDRQLPLHHALAQSGHRHVTDGDSFVMADIPGLVEGASEGVGLGHDFLRHVERTRAAACTCWTSPAARAATRVEDYRRDHARSWSATAI